MANTYEIDNVPIESLESLLEVLANNFLKCHEYFSDNKLGQKRLKSLISFVKGFDKDLANKVNKAIVEARYLHNALTFIIFELSKHTRVIINGKPYSFTDFIQGLKANGRDNQIYSTFLLDKGLSKTFGLMYDEPNFCNIMSCVEDNISNDLVFEFITTYNEYYTSLSYVTSIVSGIVINNDECFLRGELAFNEHKFLITLAHKIQDLAPILKAVNSNVCTFKIIKLLYGIVDTNDLLKLISNTFFDNLLVNYNNYKYKSKEANEVKKSLTSISSIMKKLLKEFDGEDEEAFYKLVDLKEDLYNAYLAFINCYKNRGITAKAEEYEMNQEYCSTLICKNYVENNVINLNHISNLPDTKLDLKSNLSYDEKIVKKQKKFSHKLNRFGFNICLLGLLNLIISILFIASSFLKHVDGMEEAVAFFNQPDLNLFYITIGSTDIYDCLIIYGIASLLSIIFGIIVRANANKIFNNILNYEAYFSYQSKEGLLTKKQNRIYKKLEGKSEKLEKKVKKHYSITSCLTMGIFAIVSVCLLVNIVDILFNNGMDELLSSTFKIDGTYHYFTLIFAALFAVLYGFIKRRKGFFTPYIILILSFAGLVLSCFIF